MSLHNLSKVREKNPIGRWKRILFIKMKGSSNSIQEFVRLSCCGKKRGLAIDFFVGSSCMSTACPSTVLSKDYNAISICGARQWSKSFTIKHSNLKGNDYLE